MGFKTGMRQEKRDAGKVEGGNQAWRDTRKMGFGTRGIQEIRDTGNEGYRK